MKTEQDRFHRKMRPFTLPPLEGSDGSVLDLSKDHECWRTLYGGHSYVITRNTNGLFSLSIRKAKRGAGDLVAEYDKYAKLSEAKDAAWDYARRLAKGEVFEEKRPQARPSPGERGVDVRIMNEEER